MKIVINSDFGGFGLSDEAIREYGRRKGLNLIEQVDKRGWVFFYKDVVSDDSFFWDGNIERNDPILVEVVEDLKSEKAGNKYASLKIVEIPDGVKWQIIEYDGLEHIAEEHRTWR